MSRYGAVLGAILMAGCFSPRPEAVVEHDLTQLVSSDAGAREAAFQRLIQAGPGALPGLKRAVGLAGRTGFPVVALLYIQGEGDAVPLDLRARHVAAFRWPAAFQEENAVLEPYAWNEVEGDLVRAGAPALRFLAEALERDAPTEAKALQAARVMLRIGGRAAAEAFAGLLDGDRRLDGPRVCDVAAAALLYLGRQELALRAADPEERLKAAREWWERSRSRPAADWVVESARALAGRWQPKDPEAVRSVLELLVGKPLEDPKDWLERNSDWRPAAPPLDRRPLLAGLSGGRPEAFEANRLLEEATGAAMEAPRAERLGDLCAALRLWRPAPDLAVRWKRRLESALLRTSIVVVGYHSSRGRNHVIFAGESQFPAVEDETAEVRLGTFRGSYLFHVQSRELGTHLVVSEYFTVPEGAGGFTAEFRGSRPVAVFSGPMRSCIVAWVEEIPARQGPRSQDVLYAQARERLRAGIVEAGGAHERQRLLKALAYFQDPQDAPMFREHAAGAALLLLGDPAALEYKPVLEPHEVEMALRRAEDPKVREYLDGLPKP